MSNKPKLNDLQLILLSTAAQRDARNVFPVADSISKDEERVRKAIPPLLKRGLLDEQPIRDRRLVCRHNDEEQPIGLFITPAGRELIAPAEGNPARKAARETATSEKPAPSAPSCSKADLVLNLLRRPEGATLHEMVQATAWLPHTTRAALTGLRKRGHIIEKTKREDATCYRITEVA